VLLDPKEEIGPNTIIMGDFSNAFSLIDRSSRYKNQQRNRSKQYY
jgi:hypothetical protein